MTEHDLNRIRSNGTRMQRDLVAALIGPATEPQRELIRFGRFVPAGTWRQMQNDPFLRHLLWANTHSHPQHPSNSAF